MEQYFFLSLFSVYLSISKLNASACPICLYLCSFRFLILPLLPLPPLPSLSSPSLSPQPPEPLSSPTRILILKKSKKKKPFPTWSIATSGGRRRTRNIIPYFRQWPLWETHTSPSVLRRLYGGELFPDFGGFAVSLPGTSFLWTELKIIFHRVYSHRFFVCVCVSSSCPVSSLSSLCLCLLSFSSFFFSIPFFFSACVLPPPPSNGAPLLLYKLIFQRHETLPAGPTVVI